MDCKTEYSIPLSEGQKALWYVSQMAPSNYAYNLPVAFLVRTDLNTETLGLAIRELIKRHACLRSIIVQENEVPVQRILDAIPFELNISDISSLSEEKIHARLKAEARRPFDLSGGPLFRTNLFRIENDQTVLFFNFHHIIFDGASFNVFIKELEKIYLAYSKNETPDFPDLKTSYDDFVTYQKEMLAGKTGQQDLDYWLQQRLDKTPTLNLPFTGKYPSKNTYQGESCTFHIGKYQTEQLRKLAIQENSTLFSVMLTAFKVLLFRYTDQNTINIGIPVEGRAQSRFDSIIGYCMNMIVLKSEIRGLDTFRSVLDNVCEKTFEGIDHGYYPLFSLLQAIENAGHGNGDLPFQVAFYFQNWVKEFYRNRKDSFLLHPLTEYHQEGEFDLILEVMEKEDSCDVYFKYHTENFDESVILKMGEHYQRILRDICLDSEKRVSEIAMLGDGEKTKLLKEWNSTFTDFPSDKGVHHLFGEQARKFPNSVAVVYEGESLTYEELDIKSTRLAGYLKKNGVSKGTMVGILLNRSPDMLIGLLGVLKAGGVYIPLDPNYPEDRLNYMFEESSMSYLLTHSSLEKRLPFSRIFKVFMDQDQETIYNPSDVPDFFPVETVSQKDMAYVIFTSGSTGNPKGIQVFHKGLTNFLLSMSGRPGFSSNDYLLALTTICFDIAGLELFLPLINGGTVEILSDHITRDGIALLEKISSSPATVIQATPATYKMLFAAGWEKKTQLKLLCGGEELSNDLAAKLLSKGNELWNLYGPTETTIWSAVYKVTKDKKVCIGNPIANTQMYVLDKKHNPVPIGVKGELYIGGEGVAAGYLNRPEMTEERFMTDPFSGIEGARMYRTGDVARYMQNGELECLGRMDHQIKIRGFRVELSEVETVIQSLPGVKENAVVLREDVAGQPQLVSFIVPDRVQGDQNARSIQNGVYKKLPDYMVPSRFIMLEKLPLTLNLKVDKKFLSCNKIEKIELEFGMSGNELEFIESSETFELPGEIENTALSRSANPLLALLISDLKKICGKVLQGAKIEFDIHRPIGEYGFNSISFTSLSIKINKRYSGININPTVFFDYSTIHKIAEFLLDNWDSNLKVHFKNDLPQNTPQVKPTLKDVKHVHANRQSREQKRVANTSLSTDIAIVGMSGQFPKSPDLESFWENLINDKDLVTEIPADRWDYNEFYGEHVSGEKRSKSKWGGFLDHIDMFDPCFFGITPREAELMDPQQRLILQTVWKTIEDAGYKATDLAGTHTGVFIGALGSDYMEMILKTNRSVDGYTISGVAHTIIPNRISYLLDLKGPSTLINTGCSSSLVALHKAIKAIQSQECQSAIVGGINLMLTPWGHVALSKNNMLSEDGKCKAFDKNANGYVRGEGVAALYIKPLHVAEQDGDHIYAVIKGSAENHGGHTHGISVPNTNAQAELLAETYKNAGVDPSTISLIEAHGTGTSLGDPIEINGLKKAFSESAVPLNDNYCGVGSVKTNIGHLEAAAGVAGIVKVVLAMQYGKIPASLHCKALNPYLNIEKSPFYIVTETKDWEALKDNNGRPLPRRAGVSSFGFGGSNAHVLLEEYKSQRPPHIAADQPLLFVWSAKDAERLKSGIALTIDYLKRSSLCNTIETNRSGANVHHDIPENEFLQWIADILNVETDDIDPTEPLTDLGMDLIGMKGLAEKIVKATHINITPDQLNNLGSGHHIYRFIQDHNKAAVTALTAEGEERTNDTCSLRDMSYTLQVGRMEMDHRLAIVARDQSDLIDKLERFYYQNGDNEGVYFNDIKSDTSKTGELLYGEEGREFIRIVIKNKNLDKLAHLWTSGVKIDWELLYPSERPHRMSLPTYQFAKERYWLPEIKNDVSEKPPRASNVTDHSSFRFYEKSWTRCSEKASGTMPEGPILCLLPGDSENKISDQIDGHSVIKVFTGKADYRRVDAFQYDIDLNQPDQLEALVSDMGASIDSPFSLVDLTDLSPRQNKVEGRVLLLQRLIKRYGVTGINILHLTANRQCFKNADPVIEGTEGAAFVKLLGAEYMKVNSKTVDIDFHLQSHEELTAIIRRELTMTLDNSEICYRENQRYVPVLKSIENQAGEPALTRLEKIAEDGQAIIITGGTGGIGLRLAEFFAQKNIKKIGLMGVNALPAREDWDSIIGAADSDPNLVRKLKGLKKLSHQGVRLELYTGSLDDTQRVTGYLQHVRSGLGEIAGVIHCSGYFTEKNPAFINKDIGDIQATLDPKVKGLRSLFRSLGDCHPRFVMLFSSVAGYFPSLASGGIDYGAANAYMDDFAEFTAATSGYNCTSVIWPLWSGAGMGGTESAKYLQLGVESITPETGFELLLKAIELNKSGTIVPLKSTSEILNNPHIFLPKQTCEPAKTVENVKQPVVSKQGSLQDMVIDNLRRIFADELKLPREKMADDDNFAAIGVDSILLAELVVKIEDWLNDKLDPSMLIEYPSLKVLSDYLITEYSDALTSLYNPETQENILVDPNTSEVGSEPNPADGFSGYPEPPKVDNTVTQCDSESSPEHMKQPNHMSREAVSDGTDEIKSKVAVIGMGCHFPGAPDIGKFWENLKNRVDSISEIPSSRWSIEQYYRSRFEEGKSISKWGGFIDNIENFDPEFFKLTEDEVLHMDPLVRQLLEVSVQCMRDSGYEKDELWNKKVGVFIGSRVSNFIERIKRFGKNSIIGIGQNFIAALVSHIFNFRGPNMVVDTACSSSLVSIHLAIQSLCSGESEVALAGGVDILLDERNYILLSKGKALSPDGKCHTFDEKANGFVPGEGCGVVMLKQLDKAISDGDKIYAVIDATAINNDGNTMGITTPNAEAQRDVIEDALEKGKVDAASVSYLETHGTGTMIGDPIELRGLTHVFRKTTGEKGFCAVGSVKTNIGHLLSAAGIASVIKVGLSIYNQQIPPTLNCETPNSRFNFSESPFYPNTILKEWTPVNGKRIAGISSFGFGGTNAHLIMSNVDPFIGSNVARKRLSLPPVIFNKRRIWLDKKTENTVIRSLIDSKEDNDQLQLTPLLEIVEEV